MITYDDGEVETCLYNISYRVVSVAKGFQNADKLSHGPFTTFWKSRSVLY